MRERVWRRRDFDGVDERRHESRKPGLGSRHRRRVAFLWEDAHDPNPADGRQHVNNLTIHGEHVRVEGDRVLEAPIGQFLRRDRPEEHFQGPRGAAQKTFHLRGGPQPRERDQHFCARYVYGQRVERPVAVKKAPQMRCPQRSDCGKPRDDEET